MNLYNTLDESFHNLKKFKKISIYLCGPTVYSDIHIGNCRPIIIFDVLIRYLKFILKKEIFYIHNITDIDDKIINSAKASLVDEDIITKKYTKKYFLIWEKLGLLKASIYPRVTNEIDSIVSFINFALKKNFAYILKSGVYFSIDVVGESYGNLSHQNQAKIQIDIEKNKDYNLKKNSRDFALWKFNNEGMCWEANFGNGRPGWHTECMCLINKYNKSKSITIHGGGVDLIFPHHENERAQYLAYKKKELAYLWCHTGTLKVKSHGDKIKKMSKSEKNFILAETFLKRYGSNVLRYLFYSIHYRKTLLYEENNVFEVIKILKKTTKTLNQATFIYYFFMKIKLTQFNFDSSIWSNKNNKLFQNSKFCLEFFNNIENNLNISGAIGVLHKTIKEINVFLKNLVLNKKNFLNLKHLINDVFIFSFVLGLKWDLFNYSTIDIQIYKEWLNALKIKNYQKSDQLRKSLVEKQII